MGYTHYFRRPRELPPEGFRRFVRDVGMLLQNLPPQTGTAGGAYNGQPLRVRGPWGEGEPVLTDEEVAFNGDAAGDLDHETFAVERVYRPEPWETPDLLGRFFSFCKTARKPYDLAVTASLLLLQAHFGPSVAVSSDGGPVEWAPARELVTRVFGPQIAQAAWELIWPPQPN